MKNFTVLHILLLLLLMLAYQCTKAQDYIVTLKNDTTKGRVKILAFGPEKKVQIVTVDKKKSTFSILEIRALSFKNEKYVPVKAASGYVFMKALREGYLSLYAFQLPNQVTYDGLFLQKRDGNGMEVPNLGFKKIMTKYLQDCEAVTAKIESGELGKNYLTEIIDDYNLCIAEKTTDHSEAIVQNEQQSKKISAWDVLEEKIKTRPDFDGRTDALEMITEIKSKINENERIPNFVIDGLKNRLSNTDLSEDLQRALEELND